MSDELVEAQTALKKHLDIFRNVIDALDKSGTFEKAQRVLDDTNHALVAADRVDRRRTVEMLARFTGQTLRHRGASERLVREIERIVSASWVRAVEGHERFVMRSVLRKAVAEWAVYVERIERERSRVKRKTMLTAALILIAAGGTIIFDSAKLLVVAPIPSFMFTSFIGGAALFLNGVEKLTGRRSRSRKT